MLYQGCLTECYFVKTVIILLFTIAWYTFVYFSANTFLCLDQAVIEGTDWQICISTCPTSVTKGFYKSSKRFLTNNYLREKAVSLLEMKVLPTSVDNVLPTLKSSIATTLWQRSPNIVTTLQRHNFMSALQRLFNAASTSLKLIFWCS